MIQRFIFTISCLAVVAAADSAIAQFSRGGLISSGEAHRYGLTRKWHTRVDLDRARGRISGISQHVSSTKAQVIYQVVYDRGTINFSERGFDRFGKTLGQRGAVREAAERILQIIRAEKSNGPSAEDDATLTKTQQAAEQVRDNLYAERVESKSATTVGTEDSAETTELDIDSIVAPLLQIAADDPEALPRLERHVIPDITFYVTTNQGIVQAVDGETGRTRWAMRVGRPNHPNMAPAANDDIVAVANGSKLYVIEAETGKLLWQRWMKGVPGSSPAVTNDMVYVPLVNGRIEIYRLYKLDEEFQYPSYITATGRGLVTPTVTPGSIGWPTDRGFFYVADTVQLRARFRLEALKTIVAAASYLPVQNRFVVASVDGYVYCLHEYSGEIVWRFSAGEPISRTPVPIGDDVLAIMDNGGMYCLASETGMEKWWTPNVKKFLASSDGRLYVLDNIGRITVIDTKTGGRIVTIPSSGFDLTFSNLETDRIVLGTKTGLIQCLHETSLERPLVHLGIEIEQKQKGSSGDKSAAGADDAAAPKGDNPFGTPASKDPFGGGGADPFGGGGGADPFGGGGADPFGGGGAGGMTDDKKNSDPFGGGGDDPFK